MVVQLGVDNFRRSRQEHDSLPDTHEAMEKLINTVGREQRADKVVPLPHLTMLSDGRIHNQANGTYPLTEKALTGLCTHATPGGAGYLANCAPSLRADNLNHWLPQGFRTKDVLDDNGEPTGQTERTDKSITLRTRNAQDGSREIFAVVGPRYGALDVDKVAGLVLDAAPAGSKCEVFYDGYRAKMDILWHSNIQPEKCVAGEFFRAGIRVTTADDGTGAVKVSAIVERNLCLNLIIIDRAKQAIAKRSHRGSSIAMAGDIAQGIQTAMAKLSNFSSAWNDATVENVLERYGMESSDEGMLRLFKGLAYNRVIAVPGVRPAEMVTRLTSAWAKEPGYTRAAVVNAVTRAAHESTWNAWTVEDEVTAQGSDLLFSKKPWKLDLPEDEGQAATVAATF
jgi:hypothetical protein